MTFLAVVVIASNNAKGERFGGQLKNGGPVYFSSYIFGNRVVERKSGEMSHCAVLVVAKNANHRKKRNNASKLRNLAFKLLLATWNSSEWAATLGMCRRPLVVLLLLLGGVLRLCNQTCLTAPELGWHSNRQYSALLSKLPVCALRAQPELHVTSKFLRALFL